MKTILLFFAITLWIANVGFAMKNYDNPQKKCNVVPCYIEVAGIASVWKDEVNHVIHVTCTGSSSWCMRVYLTEQEVEINCSDCLYSGTNTFDEYEQSQTAPAGIGDFIFYGLKPKP